MGSDHGTGEPWQWRLSPIPRFLLQLRNPPQQTSVIKQAWSWTVGSDKYMKREQICQYQRLTCHGRHAEQAGSPFHPSKVVESKISQQTSVSEYMR
jgi:hypothetical protein